MYGIKKIKIVIGRVLGELRRESEAFKLEEAPFTISEKTMEAVRAIRGDHPPAIIIHGVMPRSGTVYTGELLRLHPDLHAYPNEIWELPFLELTGDLLAVQKHFFRAYRQNMGKIGDHDFLPLFGASIMAYLYSFVPAGKRMLLKIPDAQYLRYFYAVFPCEIPLLLMRDGRDLVASTINSWPSRDFGEVCRLWDNSARAMLAFQAQYPAPLYHYLAMKYEDVVARPAEFVTAACNSYSLDSNRYPYERISTLPVRGSSTMEKKVSKSISWSPMEKPKNFNPIGHWQGWTEKRKRYFKKIAGSALIECGYTPDDVW
jgi:protein-tyrosine sulfotransferase